jgi:predicted Zn-dependent peptidase
VISAGGFETEEGLKKTDLSSGLRVLSEEVSGSRSVSLGIWVDTGSRDENPGEHGLSHFMEHMLFKGTSRMNAREIAEAFDFMGADINAATGREHTYIYSRFLKDYLLRAMDIIMEMVRHSSLDAGEMDSERQVVLEEINMHNDSPDETVHDYLANVLWGDHPIGHSVLGDAEVINSVQRDTLMQFCQDRYVASRIVVAAAGAVDHQDLCDITGSRIEDLPAGAPVVRDNAMQVPLTGKYVHQKDTEQAHIAFGSRGLPRRHPDRFALSILDNIVGGSMSSRLFQKIREQMGLVYSVYSFTGLFLGMGMVGIYCGTHPGQAEKVIELIENELLLVRDNGFQEEELERAKNHIKGSLLISNEDSGNRMNRIAKAEMSGGEYLTIDEIVDRVEKVRMDDLHRVFEETWGSVKASLAVVGPFDETEIGLSGRI